MFFAHSEYKKVVSSSLDFCKRVYGTAQKCTISEQKIGLESAYIRIFFGFSAALPCENMPKTAQKTQT